MDTELFDAFLKFVSCLDQYKGSDIKGIKLYHHLLKKITSQHGGAINRNIALVKEFLKSNEKAISSYDIAMIVQSSIKYSDKVVINVKELLEVSDTDTQSIIWKHLLTMKIKSENTSDCTAIEQLRKLNTSSLSSPDLESIFSDQSAFSNILNSMGGSQLSASIKEIMESPSFKNVIEEVKQKVESGEIDIPKLQENFMSSGVMDAVGGMGGLGGLGGLAGMGGLGGLAGMGGMNATDELAGMDTTGK